MIRLENISKEQAENVEEPVSLTKVKSWLQIDFLDFDELFTELIIGARQSIEEYTSLAIVESTVTLDFCQSDFNEPFTLPYAKKVKEDTLSIVDSEETQVTDYKLRGNVLKIYAPGQYTITYTTQNTIPQALKEAVLMEVAERFQSRGENEANKGLSQTAKVKAEPYRQIWL
jgi:hypothetical protein